MHTLAGIIVHAHNEEEAKSNARDTAENIVQESQFQWATFMDNGNSTYHFSDAYSLGTPSGDDFLQDRLDAMHSKRESSLNKIQEQYDGEYPDPESLWESGNALKHFARIGESIGSAVTLYDAHGTGLTTESRLEMAKSPAEYVPGSEIGDVETFIVPVELHM